MRETITVRGPSSISNLRMGNSKPFYTPHIPKRPSGSFQGQELGRGPSLGSGNVNLDSVTIFSALGGAVAVLGSKSLPDPGNIIAKVLGYCAMGFAVYRAFFEGSADASSDKNAPGGPVPGAAIAISPTTAFEKVSGSFLSPTPGQKIGPGFLRTTYPVRIMLSNKSSEPVSFYYQIISSEDPEYMSLVDSSYNARVEGQVAQSYITLRAKEQRTIDLRVDVATSGTLVTNKISIQLSLQKKQAADSPWQSMGPGSTVAFEYSRNY
jgi:hypothetical protein